MLSLEQKRLVLNSFKELREKSDKFGRWFYYLDDASTRRKIIAREFYDSGNGYVYGANLPDYKHLADSRGWVKVKDFTVTQLLDIMQKAIDSHK